jgi:2-dehydropantoate 2-reductase
MSKVTGILGAGAIGSAIGAYLLKEGHDVTLIDQWAAHIEAMRKNGLTLTDLNGEFTVPVKAMHISDINNLRQQFDIVYLAVKSFDTRWSTYLIEPFLKPTGFILPAQNALNDEAVANIVGFNRTVGCVPLISVGLYEPGHVVRTDPLISHCFTVGELSGIITPRVEEVVDTLKIIGPSEATTNIWGTRWSKLTINCMMNALAGIAGMGTSSLNDNCKDTANFIRVMTCIEVTRVAKALGVAVTPIFSIPAEEFADASTPEDIQKVTSKLTEVVNSRYLSSEKTQKLGAPDRPSLLQDVIKGRRTEIDFLNGHVVKKGSEMGIPTPMNRAIAELMGKIERGEVKPDPSNLSRLKNSLAV